MIEDWLAKRGQFSEYNSDIEGYEKVLDIYCLHVLPRLEEWDYAKEFLQYESELPHGNRNVCLSVNGSNLATNDVPTALSLVTAKLTH